MKFLPYETLKFLGWTTVVFVSLSITFHLALILNKGLAKSKSPTPMVKALKQRLRKFIPFIRSYHRLFGTLAFMTGIVHGYSLLGSIRLHSGFLLWSLIVCLAITGISMKLVKKRYKRLHALHKLIMYVTVPLMLFHVITMQ